MQRRTRRHSEQQIRLRELVATLDTIELAELQSVWRKIYGQRTFVKSRTYLRRLLTYRLLEYVERGTSQQVTRAIAALAHSQSERWQSAKGGHRQMAAHGCADLSAA